MTRTAVQNKELDIKAEANRIADEDVKRKKRLEKSEKFKNFASGIGSAAKGIGGAIPGVRNIIHGGAALGKAFNNSPAWYLRDPIGLKNTSNLPTYHPLGTGFKSMFNRSVPGLFVMYLCPSLPGVTGNSGTRNTTFQYALNSLRQWLRRHNSVTGGLETGDVAQILLSIAFAHGFARKIKRILKSAITFQMKNRYLGQIINDTLTATSFSTVIDNLPSYLKRLNVCIRQLNTLPLPAWPIFEHYAAMWDVIFKDEDLAYGQIYMLDVPYHFTYDEAGAQISPAVVQRSHVAAMLSYLENDIAQLITYASDDVTRLYSDLLGSIPEAQMLRTDEVASDEELVIAADPALCGQIMNARLPILTVINPSTPSAIGDGPRYSEWPQIASVYFRQDSDGIMYQGTTELKHGLQWLYSDVAHKPLENVATLHDQVWNYIFNYYVDDITKEEVMYHTRLMPTYTFGLSDSKVYEVIHASDCFVPISMEVIYRDDNGAAKRMAIPQFVDAENVDVFSFQQLACLRTFNYAPTVYELEMEANGDGTKIVGVINQQALQQWGNVVEWNRENVALLHEVACVSQVNLELEVYKGSNYKVK